MRSVLSAIRKALPNLTAGELSAVVTLSYATSYGAMIFSADLKDHLPAGMPVALMSCWIIALIVTLGSSFHFTIAGPDSNATAVLALAAASIAARIAAKGAPPESVLPTVLMYMAASAILVGVVLYAIGAMCWGRLIRFIPHPVVGGFLAGTGYLIVEGAFKVTTGKPLTIASLQVVGNLHWLSAAPALLVAGVLLIVPRFWKPFFLMPAAILFGIAAFYAGLGAAGMSADEARSMDLLFAPMEVKSWTAPFNASWGLIRWDVLLAHGTEFFGMAVVTIITILLNATGLDLATGKDADFDRELRAAGFANVAAGLAGGMVGYQSISRSLLNFKAGASSRMAGVWCAILCFAVTFLLPELLAYFPRPVLAGLLFYLGVSLLIEWAIQSYWKVPRREYGLIVVILLLIGSQGFLTGVLFGVVVACVMFVFSYSRTSCIKYDFTGANRLSNVERSMEQMEALKARGERLYGLCLQGFLFFGTSNTILERVREKLAGKVRCVLIDFRMVHGLDASATLSFAKLRQTCEGHGAALILTGLDSGFRMTLRQGGILSGVREFPDMDRALEWAEEMALAETQTVATLVPSNLRHYLSSHFSRDNLNRLMEILDTLDLPKDAPVFRRGDPGDSLCFVESGQVSVSLPLEGGSSFRLRAFGPGTIVGEMGLFSRQPRSADVVCDCQSRLRKLTREKLDELEKTHPQAAIQFHDFVIKVMASRLTAANEGLRSFL